jgi:hypothetical protein
VKAIFRIAESNLDALNTVDLGPKRLFGVGECALWARSTGPRFAAQVAVVVGLVEAPANHRKATTVAKEVMAIKYSNKTSHLIKKFLYPKATQMIPQYKLLPFLKSVEPPIFENPNEASKEIFKMNIAATEGKGGVLMVHYVDSLVAVVRYQYVKKLGEDVGADLDVTMIEPPELTTRIVSAYPHLKKIEKMDPEDFKTELAATKMQNMWLRKKAGTRIKAKRREMEVELAVRKGSPKGLVPPDIAALSAHELTKALRDSETGSSPNDII